MHFMESFEVDSNIEEVRWVIFILKSAVWLLEAKDEWEHEIASISLTVKWRKDETFSLDHGYKVENFFLKKKESNEEEGESSFEGISEEK